MPTFSQIDQNVLQELPEEIKNEVLQQVTPKKKSTLRIIKRPKKKDVPPPVKITEMLNAVPIMNEAQKEELENIKNNISSIDYNVVKELPTKIQMEILNEKISKRKKQEKQEKDKEEVIIKKKKKDEMMMYKSSYAKIEQMKSCVSEWMIIDVTEDGDVYMELLLQFVNQLFCGEKDMEGGVRFLKMIRRMALSRDNQSWKELFDRLLRNVNDQVLPMSGLCDVAETRIAVDFLNAGSL
jgi:Zn-dependent metalloprotease